MRFVGKGDHSRKYVPPQSLRVSKNKHRQIMRKNINVPVQCLTKQLLLVLEQ